VALAFAYAAFIDQVTLQEACAGIACAFVIGAFAVRLERIVGDVPVPPFTGVVQLLVRTPLGIVREAWLILGPFLWRAMLTRGNVRGRWVEIHYEPERAREGFGRRALVILASAITPNSIPLDVDAARGRVVLHQLYQRSEPGADDPRFPF